MERTYTIPLRRAFLKTPKYVRTNRAVREVKSFLVRHMKTPNVKLGEELNKALWSRGDSKPPSRVTVLVTMEDKTAYAELVGKDFKKKAFNQEAKEERGLPTETPKPMVPGSAEEIIGKAATAKAKAEGAIKEDKPAAKKKAPAKK